MTPEEETALHIFNTRESKAYWSESNNRAVAILEHQGCDVQPVGPDLNVTMRDGTSITLGTRGEPSELKSFVEGRYRDVWKAFEEFSRMEEFGEIARRVMKEYEPQLPIRGVRSYTPDAKDWHILIGSSVRNFRREDMESAIRSLLGGLNDGQPLIISEPRETIAPGGCKLKNVREGKLRLSITSGWSHDRDFVPYIRVDVWYYPEVE